jgi:hypothetical protein
VRSYASCNAAFAVARPHTTDHAAYFRYVGPRPKTSMGVPEKGWLLVTPAYSKDSSKAILVRRGWVPDSWRTSAEEKLKGGGSPSRRAKHSSDASGVGVVTAGERASYFVLPNEPETGSWHWIDAVSMVRNQQQQTGQSAYPCTVRNSCPFMQACAAVLACISSTIKFTLFANGKAVTERR